jgi:hypothetical protein
MVNATTQCNICGKVLSSKQGKCNHIKKHAQFLKEDCSLDSLYDRLAELEATLSTVVKEMEFLRNKATIIINNNNTFNNAEGSTSLNNGGNMNSHDNNFSTKHSDTPKDPSVKQVIVKKESNNNPNGQVTNEEPSPGPLTINKFGVANEDGISSVMWKKLVTNPSTEDAILTLIEKLHFSTSQPENMSIFAHPNADDKCVIMKNTGWSHENMKETIQDLVQSTADRLAFEIDNDESDPSYTGSDCKRINDFVAICYDGDIMEIEDLLKKVEECARKNSRKVIRTLARKGIEINLNNRST